VRLEAWPERGFVLRERGGEVLEPPAEGVGRDAREDEVVDGRKEPEGDVPPLVVPDERARGRGVVRETLGEPRIERRAERLEVLRLRAEDLRERAQAAFDFASSPDAREAFAFSATAANAAGSATARSASDLRSSSMPALWTPFMNWL
jgi:hypothetical protein